MRELTIRRFMTATPRTVGAEDSLAAARLILSAHRIRHLPVLSDGKLVGMLSEHQVELSERLPGVDPNTIRVRDVMSSDLYVIGPSSSFEWVVTEMALYKYDIVVVVERAHVVGVFTTTDALRALGELVRWNRYRPAMASALVRVFEHR